MHTHASIKINYIYYYGIVCYRTKQTHSLAIFSGGASDPKSLHSQSDFQLPLLQTQTQNFPSTSNWNISQSSRDCAVGSLARFHFIVHRREGCEYGRRSTANKATRGQICLQLRHVARVSAAIGNTF